MKYRSAALKMVHLDSEALAVGIRKLEIKPPTPNLLILPFLNYPKLEV